MAIQTLYGRQHLYPTLGQSLGSGLGEGLSMLLHHKVESQKKEKRAKEWENIGLPAHLAQFLVNQPEKIQLEAFKKFTGSENKATPSPAQQEVIEKRKDKLRPDLTYLDDLERTSKELRSLINDKQEPVEFGLKASVLSSLPVVGNQYLEDSTGAFNALANKFHTDATQGAKNVRSVYHVKILGASKPGLDKTKGQNEKILDHWDKAIAEKRAKFLKAHPEFKDEVSAEEKSESADNKSQKVQIDDNGNIYVNGKLFARPK